MNVPIEIKLSKKKIFLLFLGGLGFVVFGAIGAIHPEKFVSLRHHSITLIRTSSIAALLFFGMLLPFIVQKLVDKSPGLTINDDGITVNSGAINIGLIPWDDIKSIEKITVASAALILVHVRNPKKYIDREKNRIAKFFMDKNRKKYKTPISVVSSSLDISINELEILLKNELDKRKVKAPSYIEERPDFTNT